MNNCHICGNNLGSDDVFCQSCGSRIDGINSNDNFNKNVQTTSRQAQKLHNNDLARLIIIVLALVFFLYVFIM